MTRHSISIRLKGAICGGTWSVFARPSIFPFSALRCFRVTGCWPRAWPAGLPKRPGFPTSFAAFIAPTSSKTSIFQRLQPFHTVLSRQTKIPIRFLTRRSRRNQSLGCARKRSKPLGSESSERLRSSSGMSFSGAMTAWKTPCPGRCGSEANTRSEFSKCWRAKYFPYPDRAGVPNSRTWPVRCAAIRA